MLLLELIVALVVVSISSLRITMKRKTGNESWGEPLVTILQILGILVILFLLAVEHSMMAG